MQKYLITLTTVLCLVATISAKGQGGSLGLGVIAGNPTGLSAKLWAGENHAFDAALAWDLNKKGGMHVHADYLYHNYNLISVSSGQLPLYFGPGAQIGIRDDLNVGVRFPVGIAYYFANAPVDIFLEIAPVFTVIQSTGFGVNGGIGARFFF